jgi:sRNA-binding regulator protein Hfq
MNDTTSSTRPTLNFPKKRSSPSNKPKNKYAQQPKATYSHEAALNDILKDSGIISLLNSEGGDLLRGELVGYDAFTISVKVDGRVFTYFKHSVAAFTAVKAETSQ